MKASIFNNYITLSNGTILGYNSFTRRFAVIPRNLHLALTETSTNMNSDGEDWPSPLKEAGFLIPDSLDEVAVLDREITEEDFNQSFAEIHVNPTLNCNFRCWYCYEEHQPDSELGPEVYDALCNYISNLLESPVKRLNLGFFGGEPLLKFDKICRPLIEWTAEKCRSKGVCFHTHFTTNSYLLTPEIVDLLKKYECGLQITLDGHREFHNKVRFAKGGHGSYDRILHNVAMASEAGISIVLRINYTMGNLDSVGDIISDLANLKLKAPEGIVINFQRVWQDRHKGENDRMNSKISEFYGRLKELGVGFSLPDLNNPRTGSCYGDKRNYICINYNGDFFKCTARDFKTNRRAGHLAPDGSLIWEPGRKEAWENGKFSFNVCRGCRIAPLCLGGCRQRGVESVDDGSCPLGYDENRKDEIILQRFEYQYLKS